MLALLLLVAVAPNADTAVITTSLAPPERAALVKACNTRFACASGERVSDAIEDAASLGITCGDDDGTCWQRFLAAEGFVRAVVGMPKEGRARVVVVELTGPPRAGEGAQATAAFDAVFAPPPVVEPPVDVTPPPVDPPPPETPALPPKRAPEDEGPNVVLWSVAGAAAVVGVGAGVAAAFVTAELSRDLDEAEAGRARVEDYNGRNTLFFALATTSAIGVVAAAAVAGVAVASE